MRTADERALDAVLEAIARHGPDAAERARRSLRLVLADVRRAPPERAAWRSSQLTGDGYPVEFTFSSADELVRWTADPWPTHPPASRLALAAELCAAFDQPIASKRLEALAARHAGSEAQWGTWVGGRHDCGPCGDRLKLYVEIGQAHAWTSDALGGPTLPDRPVRHRITALDVATGVREDYYRVERLASYHLPRLLRHAGCEQRANEVVDLLVEATGRRADRALPGGTSGFSLTRAPDQPTVFVLFLFARSLWGGDSRILRGLVRLADRRGWDLGAYSEAAAPVADRDQHATWHGLVGVVVAGDRPLDLVIGLRPPPTATA